MNTDRTQPVEKSIEEQVKELQKEFIIAKLQGGSDITTWVCRQDLVDRTADLARRFLGVK